MVDSKYMVQEICIWLVMIRAGYLQFFQTQYWLLSTFDTFL